MNPANHPSPITNYRLGLIGFPLGHSLSPKIHSAALKSCHLQGDYSLFPVHPDDQKGLKELIARIRSGELHGVNVTIPHKQNVIPFLDEFAPAAKAIGAVNTIYLREDKLIGDNTDAPGFLADLKRFLPAEARKRENSNVLVLGAGGSARAVVYALHNDGWNIVIAARRVDQARQLADSFTDYQLRITDFTDLQLSTFNLIVNTTPLGMSPDVKNSPLPENNVLNKDTMVYDLVYNPRQTKLVEDARAQGCSATTGLGMLVEQAALAFEIWTGCNPPREALRAAVE